MTNYTRRGCPFSSSLLLNVAVPTMISSSFIKLSTVFLTSLQNMFSPIVFNSNLVLRCHPYQLNLPLPHTHLLKYIFHYRSVKIWASLPYCRSPTLTFFKKLLMPYLCQAIFNLQHNV